MPKICGHEIVIDTDTKVRHMNLSYEMSLDTLEREREKGAEQFVNC